jgi:hypothetical protein
VALTIAQPLRPGPVPPVNRTLRIELQNIRKAQNDSKLTATIRTVERFVVAVDR